jgi:glycosyltransferase involved in cell wall biosynthesis
VLLEAMAIGVPVVATRCRSGPSEILGRDAGLLVDVDDVDGLADALTLVLSDEQLASKLSVAGRNRASDYDLARISDRWVSLLSELRPGS